MTHTPKRFVQGLTAGILVALFAVPQSLFAQASEHLVSPSELRQSVVDASQARQRNIRALDDLFSSQKAEDALKSARIDRNEVKNAVAGLSDAELAQLATKANAAQRDFAAGTLSDRDLIFILVAIAALILIIVAVR
jgi:CHASE3 domain sensor protein